MKRNSTQYVEVVTTGSCCVFGQDPLTGYWESMIIPVPAHKVEDYWRGNQSIQNVFPQLTADQREFIMTGMIL